jgi:hypothetical protein
MTPSATQRHHLKTLARLRRVNKQLVVWDEWDGAELVPIELRQPIVPPMLDREQLRSLRLVLLEHLEELDLRYSRG